LLNGGKIKFDQIGTLGQRWRLADPGILLKRYPVCSAAHALIEQTAALVVEAQCGESDVAAAICEVPELVDISLIYDTPTRMQQAQFSLPYAVACALRYGTVRLKDLNPERIAAPEIRALMARVEKRVDPELSTDTMREQSPESARVTLVLNDGRRFSGFCGEAYGMPGRPLSDEDLVGKFSDCLCFAGHGPDSAAKFAMELLFPKEPPSARSIVDIVNDIWGTDKLANKPMRTL
jgi:2-methylcitrate dehydratase PrpD